MEKELHNHPFSLSPSICQPFVLSVSKQAVGILRTGLWKASGAWFDRPVLSDVEGLTMSGTTTFTACVTYARLNSKEISHNAAIVDRDGSRGSVLQGSRGMGVRRGSEGGW